MASARASTRAQKAGSSTPAPMHAPWTRAVARGPSSCSSRPGLRVVRISCASTGSGVVPNWPRSPPLQKLGPAPRRTTSGRSSSAITARSTSTSASRIAALYALCTSGRLSDTVKTPSTCSMSTGSTSRVAAFSGTRSCEPRGELCAAEQHRIRKRLRDNGLGHREGLRHAQQLDERDRGAGVRSARGLDWFER